MPENAPAGFEIWILKWILLPCIAIGLLIIFFDVGKGREKCEAACHKEDYPDFRYIPRGKFGVSGNHCYCLTEEQAAKPHGERGGTQVY